VCISFPFTRTPLVMGIADFESACEYIVNCTVSGLYIFVLNTFTLTNKLLIIIIIIIIIIIGTYVIDWFETRRCFIAIAV
jgi:hypothetical protein